MEATLLVEKNIEVPERSAHENDSIQTCCPNEGGRQRAIDRQALRSMCVSQYVPGGISTSLVCRFRENNGEYREAPDTCVRLPVRP